MTLGKRHHATLVIALGLLALLVTGCSVSGGGSSSSSINYNVALQGATNDHPATPPQIASGAPNLKYAFVYDNQVWVRQKDNNVARQVTQLTLSAGADIVWGPLVWSPNHDLLAFSLVVNQNPSQITNEFGQIYFIDLSKCLSSTAVPCVTKRTPMTGSVYGHTYTWYEDSQNALLIAGGGGGISAYDLNDPNGPRVWQLRTTTSSENQDQNCAAPSSYGDVQALGSRVFYTCMSLSNLGSVGGQGSAYLNYLSLDPYIYATSLSDGVARDQAIGSAQNSDVFTSNNYANLGSVYDDAGGQPVAGAWAASNGGVAWETIGNVDGKAATAQRSLCFNGGTYGSYYGYVYCNSILSSVKSAPTTVHPQISLGPNNDVAYQADQLYASKFSSSMATTSAYPAQWAADGTLLVTTVVSTATDASGVTRQTMNIQLAQGSNISAVIPGASDLALG